MTPEPTTHPERAQQIAHLSLAAEWLQANGRAVNTITIDRVVRRYSAQQLTLALAFLQAGQ